MDVQTLFWCVVSYALGGPLPFAGHVYLCEDVVVGRHLNHGIIVSDINKQT